MVVVPTAKVWNLADVLISMYENYICHPIAVTNFLNVRVYEKKKGDPTRMCKHLRFCVNVCKQAEVNIQTLLKQFNLLRFGPTFRT